MKLKVGKKVWCEKYGDGEVISKVEYEVYIVHFEKHPFYSFYYFENGSNLGINKNKNEQLHAIKYVSKKALLKRIEALESYVNGKGNEPVKEEPKIEVGMFGKFWDNYDYIVHWGFLASIKHYKDWPYRSQHGYNYKNFSPGLPPNVNPDGSVNK